MKSVSQLRRLIYLIFYLVIFSIINKILFDTFLPELNYKGFWFYTGLVSLIIGRFLVTPFFTSPANGLSYAVAAFLAVLFTSTNLNNIPFILTLSFILIMIVFALISIATNITKHENWKKVSFGSRLIVENFGNPIFLYTILLLYAVIRFHSDIWIETFGVLIAGIIVLLKVVERADEVISKIVFNIRSKEGSKLLGKVEAYQIPDIVLIRVEVGEIIQKNSFLVIYDNNFGIKLGISIGYTGRDENLLLKFLELPMPLLVKDEINSLQKYLSVNEVMLLSEKLQAEIRSVSGIDWNSFLGIIDVDSSIEHISIEIINEQEVEEGRLIETEIKGIKVLYQILEGLTIEDIVAQKNKYGYARAKARKIGKWNNEKHKFENVKWMPQINCPVFLKKKEDIQVTEEAIGIFPETNYYVTIKDMDSLVTHNTAILGILGVGKSMLSIELVERMISKGIKIVCIDLTNQYMNELKEFIDKDREESLIKKIIEAGKEDKISDSPEEGGSYSSIREAISKDLQEFLSNGNYFLKVYNPSVINGTRQFYEPKTVKDGSNWKRIASLWSITPVEITQMITEECLLLLQDKMSDKARVCLIFEEAHSLIPEWNSIVTEGDKKAAMGTARAILQGRKYGLGCILVTQRTANVTKTILNQCNTIFAMRNFDETGKEFLANYFGYDYTKILSTIPERQAVVFGKGSSCENPVLIQVNDREKFKGVYRVKNPIKKLPEWKEEILEEGNTTIEDILGEQSAETNPDIQ